MNELIVAVATDNGETLMSRHFGDAKFYNIYTISQDTRELVKQIENTVEEEDESLHADPKKAQGIGAILKKEKVRCTVSKVFGPNIKRIKKSFVCIITNTDSIDTALDLCQNNYDNILQKWHNGENRKILDLR